MIDFDALTLAPCVEVFGTPVRYRTLAGVCIDTLPDGSPLRGIFEAASKEVRLNREGDWTDSTRPQLGIRVRDLVMAGCPRDALPCDGEQFEIDGRLWTISGAPPADSEGHMRITLMYAGTA